RLADAFFEEREEQLVLAVEGLVEPSQRLLGAIDDLLDRELGRAPLVDQRERRIQESLDALLRAGPRGAQALRDRALTPCRSVPVVKVIGFRHWKLHSLRMRIELPVPPAAVGVSGGNGLWGSQRRD